MTKFVFVRLNPHGRSLQFGIRALALNEGHKLSLAPPIRAKILPVRARCPGFGLSAPPKRPSRLSGFTLSYRPANSVRFRSPPPLAFLPGVPSHAPPPGCFRSATNWLTIGFAAPADHLAIRFLMRSEPQGFVSANPKIRKCSAFIAKYLILDGSGSVAYPGVSTASPLGAYRGESRWGWPILHSICNFRVAIPSHPAFEPCSRFRYLWDWAGPVSAFFSLAAVSLATRPVFLTA